MPLFLDLVRQEAHGDADRLRQILRGVERYQAGPTALPACGGEIVRRIGSAALREYKAATGAKPKAPPILFIPSLVNPPSIMDFGERSLLRHLAAMGFDVFMLDWGEPGDREVAFDLGDHVRRIEDFASDLAAPVLAGYCLGGTLAVAAAARTNAGLSGLATIAAPWDFGGYPDTRRAGLLEYWEHVAPSAEALGKVPMDLVQPAFWALDPTLPARKFERYAALPDASDAARDFERLEDWANSGHAIPLPAMDEAIRFLFGANGSGRGEWRIAGRPVDAAKIDLPWVDIRSRSDRIVPAAAGPPASDVRTLASGHVGMMIGRQAEATLWQPLAEWLGGL